ncbi:hypothetical protein O181_032388 [Austropuccinia psidii MF-1]|uniref:Uncharacterized protein n=1 Tax=Austropuccinia psidii MF-1 TaxID=1389203 RepID=A0A9Q3D1H3_9BASI|nr:hypothetical protein [Austropuccinia psidii MF-1]
MPNLKIPKVMVNVKPDSQSSAYEFFQRKVRENQEEEEGNTSCQSSHNIGIKGTNELQNVPNSIQPFLSIFPVKVQLKTTKEEIQKKPNCIDRNWSMNR